MVSNNSSAYSGFRPFSRAGAAPQYALEMYAVNSSDTNLYFTGDIVIRSTAGANAINLYLTSTAASVPLGVFWGCEFLNTAAQRLLQSRFYPGSVGSNAANGQTRCWVITDPDVWYTAISTGTLSSADIGLNFAPLSSQSSLGNTTTGWSAMVVSTATATNGSSAPLKFFDLLANRSVAGAGSLPAATGSGVLGTDVAAFNVGIFIPNGWERAAGTVGPST